VVHCHAKKRDLYLRQPCHFGQTEREAGERSTGVQPARTDAVGVRRNRGWEESAGNAIYSASKIPEWEKKCIALRKIGISSELGGGLEKNGEGI